MRHQYGMYHVMHEDDFMTWPPSPQLAMAIFPYIRSVYFNLWKEFALPYEIKLNRQLLGLPAPQEGQDQAQGQNQHAANDNQRNAQDRNADGGIVGLLQAVLDALDPDDDQGHPAGANDINRIEIVQEPADALEDGQGAEIMVELQIEEVELDENGDPVVQEQPPNPLEDEEPEPHPGAWGEDAPQLHADQELAALPPLDNDQGDQDQNQGGHEVPQAPPRRMGLSAILSNVSNAIVGALIMPGISYAMGEALRLVLPKAWTTVGPRNPWSRYGMVGRPGLLQQQWGRSLVGGCLYVVLKDVVRVYTKSRRVAAMGNRRVKNVDRRRRDK